MVTKGLNILIKVRSETDPFPCLAFILQLNLGMIEGDTLCKQEFINRFRSLWNVGERQYLLFKEHYSPYLHK